MTRQLVRLKMFRILLATVFVLVVACGFQLQTQLELPVEMAQLKLEIQSPNSEFARRIESMLEQNGAQIVSTGKDAATLEIPLNRIRREIQSIGENARVREYRLRHTVQFRLLDNENKELISLQTLEQSRIYSFTRGNILASERENEFLRNELSESMARMVIMRLGTFGNQLHP